MNLLHQAHTFLDNLPSGTSLAAAASGVAGLSVAGQVIPLPPGTPPEVALVVVVLGPVITLLVGKFLAVRAAKKKARAELLEKRAAALRSDADPSNDKEADRLEEEAAAEKAEAEALERRR